MLLTLLAGALLAVGLLIWARRDRAFASTASVAEAYDRWTDDQLLERLWGDHVHLGHYGSPPRRRDFRAAKVDFVHELVRWSGLDQLPPGSRVLDVGCGIGGSARILARDYGFFLIVWICVMHSLASTSLCELQADATVTPAADCSWDGCYIVTRMQEASDMNTSIPPSMLPS